MTKSFQLALALSASLLTCGTALAHGEFKCDVPKAEWRKQMDLQQKLLDDGWKKVRQVKVDNGCYEVYGFDENGKARRGPTSTPRPSRRSAPSSSRTDASLGLAGSGHTLGPGAVREHRVDQHPGRRGLRPGTKTPDWWPEPSWRFGSRGVGSARGMHA